MRRRDGREGQQLGSPSTHVGFCNFDCRSVLGASAAVLQRSYNSSDPQMALLPWIFTRPRAHRKPVTIF
jgi:hypothetical protein